MEKRLLKEKDRVRRKNYSLWNIHGQCLCIKIMTVHEQAKTADSFRLKSITF